jgi:hypothetical protein
MAEKIYSINSDFSSGVNLSQLDEEVSSSEALTGYTGMVLEGDELKVNADTINETLLDGIISFHVPDYSKATVETIIKNAIYFGEELLVDFASDNVLMGITQAGKTKAVADYLSDVTRYMQTGSLYEVLNEIDRLKLEGLPVDLEPFITTARLDAFKAKIQEYLT